ncbi:transaldolase [Breznakia sp. PF5-3]|uniref:transaldolase family protein n=1 Tax=unclassified Breznakia TaxID=2623764 RepID=UPI002405C4AE|nr:MULTISPECIES: transaldolase family protein [unclassified Breznakia]MDL2276424.1 transaldolase family protein [Breznakia sp. OttesenSCG-928-G09]MDF9823810.1 transaldolase [Breznakia sp. PM6-1]MDF9834624.1 transaldolase [Breznakia sp. PF5-3]MDF9836759.1 transaldolase [Breznakia sp. PFB2-8]MDF9858792.1 transaldolase [Breznakia sp. PH5-24]
MNKIKQVIETFPKTDIWVDSFHVEDHKAAIALGSVGVTTSPTWVSRMMLNEDQQANVEKIIADNPNDNEFEIMWKWTLAMGKERSKVMLPIWEAGQPQKGRFSIQTSILEYRNAERMIEMAEEVDALGANMQVKIPATTAGIKAMEEATYKGISVMATICFSVDQAVAVAEAIERGMKRREAEGKDNTMLNPVCAVLLGMQEDWLKDYAEKNNIVVHPSALPWAGVAICKKVAEVYKERGFKTRILTAYYRHHLHYSEFFGGDIIMTIPYKWQKRFDNSDVVVEETMSKKVDSKIMEELFKLEPFVKAYSENSFVMDLFDSIPPVILTIRYFTQCYEDALTEVKNIMLPDPLK